MTALSYIKYYRDSVGVDAFHGLNCVIIFGLFNHQRFTLSKKTFLFGTKIGLNKKMGNRIT